MYPKFDYGYYWEMRNECVKKFGEIFDLPIIEFATPVSEYSEGNILDVGAGKELGLFYTIKDRIKQGKYWALDNNPLGNFDFREPEDIPAELSFSLIVANQFFEHLSIEEAVKILFQLSGHLDKNGKIYVSVPNISHPVRFFGDITHKTWWSYVSLYTIFKLCGLEVLKISRSSKRHRKGMLEKIITNYLARIYRIDWCDAIIVVAQKQ